MHNFAFSFERNSFLFLVIFHEILHFLKITCIFLIFLLFSSILTYICLLFCVFIRMLLSYLSSDRNITQFDVIFHFVQPKKIHKYSFFVFAFWIFWPYRSFLLFLLFNRDRAWTPPLHPKSITKIDRRQDSKKTKKDHLRHSEKAPMAVIHCIRFYALFKSDSFALRDYFISSLKAISMLSR